MSHEEEEDDNDDVWLEAIVIVLFAVQYDNFLSFPDIPIVRCCLS